MKPSSILLELTPEEHEILTFSLVQRFGSLTLAGEFKELNAVTNIYIKIMLAGGKKLPV